MIQTVDIRDTGDAMFAAFSQSLQTFMAFLPSLLGAIIILVIGWILSGFLARLIVRGLNAIGFERAVEHSGVGNFVRRSGTTWTTSRIVAELIKWFIRLIFIQAAANILAMPQLTTIINSIILFIPNLIVAMVIIIVGAMIANFLSRMVRASLGEMGVQNPNLLANLTRYAIIGFAIIAAANQLGVAAVVVNTLFIGLVGALALAFGLALGIGGRDVGARIAESLYRNSSDLANQAQQKSAVVVPGENSTNKTQL